MFIVGIGGPVHENTEVVYTLYAVKIVASVLSPPFTHANAIP